ncbi:hypothetical protein UCDDA912_g05014 [Diaporthe ampelina]|uniref:Uncharacterized protein n=1 Tax=Diaporthe ampelina TaxID=1214573 RepID=A0A0G2FM16_9PEZI|nr:hypothetical protein UCDDA912_g05014 [Diaporthe ampelina]
MGNMSLEGVSSNQLASPELNQDHLNQDEKTSGFVTRFFGNMMIARIGRASWQSMESTARLPFYLSPWGDNTPFTLPNVRKRDLALAGVSHFGLDALGVSAVTVMEKAVETTAEQGVDEGLAKITGKYGKAHQVVRKIGVNSVTLKIRHKLIGEGAELVFQGLLRPRLAADASIAPVLLSSFTDADTPVLAPLGCPWEDQSFKPTAPAYPKFRRIAIFIAGISPYRYITSQSAWSHSRIPNEAKITFHLFTHVPAIVLPVRDKSPILAWSPWTIARMFEKKTKYDVKTHVKELLEFVETAIDEKTAAENPQWREIVEAALRSMLGTVLNVPDAIRETSQKNCELERAGVVLFRY